MEKFGSKFENTYFWKGLKGVSEWLMIICSVCCSGVLIISTIMRYVLTKNWYGSDEIILIFAFWLYFMGAVYASYENSHIKADIISSLVRNIRAKDTVAFIAQIVLVIVNLVLICWAVPYLVDAIVKMPRTTSLKIPLFVPRIAILLSLVWMEFYHLYYLIRNGVNFFRIGYFSTPGEYDYFPEKLMTKYPNTGLPTKEQMAEQRKKEAEEYISQTTSNSTEKEDN